MSDLSFGRHAAEVRAALDRLRAGRFIARLWDRDPSLWSADPSVQAAIRNRLGWLRITDIISRRLDELVALRRQMREAGFTHALLLGMGGSGLFTEVCRNVFGIAGDAIDLAVLDTTDATAIRLHQQRCALQQLFVIVSSKSGSTSEISALSKYFSGAFQSAGLSPADHAIAITDEGTPLADQAAHGAFRRAFIHDQNTGADVGGRFSALAYFGVVPAALMGVDVARLAQRVQEMFTRCGPQVPLEDNPALQLGAMLGALASAGREKMTLLCSPELASFGTWVEQLIAESTGKSGKGIAPFFGEPLDRAVRHPEDRVFIELQLASHMDAAVDQRVRALIAEGHPVARIHWRDRYDLGGEVAKWAIATAVAGHLMELNPFDEPNVKESKDRTKALLDHYGREKKFPAGAPLLCQDGNIAAYGKRPKTAEDGSLVALLGGLFREWRPRDYVAVLSFLPRTDALDRAAHALRQRLGEGLDCATAIGFGPRYLHSTGQLYKGGPDAAIFLLLTGETADDLPIPGEPFSFNILKQAQALGDFEAMQQRSRRVLHLHLRGGTLDHTVAHLLRAVDDALATSPRR